MRRECLIQRSLRNCKQSLVASHRSLALSPTTNDSYRRMHMSNEKPQSHDERLQREFNRWADEGEGAKMERHYLDITEKTMRRMELRPGERILDLGCGSGWARSEEHTSELQSL